MPVVARPGRGQHPGMKSRLWPRSLACVLTLMAGAAAGQGSSLDTNRIDQITGLKGAWNAAEGVFKVSAPRNDVAVNVDQWKMPPFMGLTSWASFLAGQRAEAMIMGDFVLFEDEVNPAMSAALD